MIATCPRCRNTGHVDERYCSCEAAMALRARIDSDPRVQQLRAAIDRNLDEGPQPTFVELPGGRTFE